MQPAQPTLSSTEQPAQPTLSSTEQPAQPTMSSTEQPEVFNTTEVATIVGTATNQGHAFDATHGGLIDGNDLDGAPTGACSTSVR